MARIMFFIALVPTYPPAYATLYKCKTEAGKTAYQDTPCVGAKQSTLVTSSAPTTEADLASTNKKSFTGEKISLNFQSAPIAMILQVIADFSGQKITVAPGVTHSGSFHYVNQPWDAVLADIAAKYSLNVVKQGNELKISPR